MTTRTVVPLSILLGLCVTGCPESKTETAPEPKSAESVKAAGSGAADEKAAGEGEKKEEGGW